MSTDYHAKYFAHELTRRHSAAGGIERLSMSLFDACVDLNPHQIEASLFALRSPISKGVILADEVGLGKTIEAGLVLCQRWAEQRRRLLVICPALLRKQWSLELEEKFNLPTTILDAKAYRDAKKNGNPSPFVTNRIVIASINFVSRMRDDVRLVGWDHVVIDEAHKLRNAYRASNKMGQNIRWAISDRKKTLLTATPLQNSLLELYGLSTIIDEHIFGDVASFRTQYTNVGGNLDELRDRLRPICTRTLRRQVLEYVQYTERRPITRPFRPSDEEHRLYEALTEFLSRDDTYAIPQQQRQLVTLILRKLLASSSHAIAGTLRTIKSRLLALREERIESMSLAEHIIEGDELEDEYLDELIAETEGESDEEGEPDDVEAPPINLKKLDAEIAEIDAYIRWASSIGVDTKTRSLLTALEIGLQEMGKLGAAKKALIFTESRRTQDYLKNYLDANGYAGRTCVFNGTNSGPESQTIYQRWRDKNTDSGRATGSKIIDVRTALIEHFRDNADILIATEAAAEGINLQFCSLVINYDLPWNPQRIEQRIGRCHRYGQKHDVVVINFLNERNDADQRVLQLLTEKFHLFSGVFGASDDVLGSIESGVDFEKRILQIYQDCRTPQQIDAAFKALQLEMDEQIKAKLDDTQKLLLEHFDEDVHARLRSKLDDTRQHLDRMSRMFWSLTKHALHDHAEFDDRDFTFTLTRPPLDHFKRGQYHLISKNQENIPGEFLYRLSHPLGEHVVQVGKLTETPVAEVVFDVANHPGRIALVERLAGQSGWLILQMLTIESFEREEYLLFSGQTDNNGPIDQETAQKLFNCLGTTKPAPHPDDAIRKRLTDDAARHVKATISRSLEANNQHFQQERERLDKWADDMVVAAEKELDLTKQQIKALNREARLATTTDQQRQIQERIQSLEKKKRRQRQEIFDREDEIAEKRDTLIDVLEKQLSRKTTVDDLFLIRWSVE